MSGSQVDLHLWQAWHVLVGRKVGEGIDDAQEDLGDPENGREFKATQCWRFGFRFRVQDLGFRV